jgi:hypothetical protein
MLTFCRMLDLPHVVRHPLALAVVASLCVAGPWNAAAGQPRAVARRSAPAAGAWALPDVESLVSKAIVRIITQDRPAGIPIAEYSAKRFGRTATIDAVRQYNGRSLDPGVFASVSDWTDTRALDVAPCPAVGGVGCATPSGVWIAITRLERGDLPHEMHLWYTTQFTAAPALEGQQPQAHRYTFCERWLRTGGIWKYDGFVRMVPQ